MSDIKHPLPVGTIIKVNTRSFDSGVMSWDDDDIEIEREAPAGSTCSIVEVFENGQYSVEFLPSEVWNFLEPGDFEEHPEHYEIIELGNGTHAESYTAYYADENRPRDPEAVRKINEKLEADGPSP